MCTLLLPPGGYPIAVNKYVRYLNCKLYYQQLHLKYLCVTWQGTGYEFPEDDTTLSKYVGFWCIYLSGLVTAVAVFRNPNTIPFCLTTDLLLSHFTYFCASSHYRISIICEIIAAFVGHCTNNGVTLLRISLRLSNLRSASHRNANSA